MDNADRMPPLGSVKPRQIFIDAIHRGYSPLEFRPARAYAGFGRGRGRPRVGVNVAGERREPPNGQLDVWVPVPNISKVAGIPPEEIRNALKRGFTVESGGVTDCIVRLKSMKEAQELVSLLGAWLTAIKTTETDSSNSDKVDALS
jgi:hypothetical protein